MELTPLKKYKAPAYPCKEAVSSNPDLLRHIPKRWQSKLLLGILCSSLACITLSGCGSQTAGTPLAPYFMSEEEALNIITEELKKDGLTIEKGGPTIKDIKLPVKKYDVKENEPAETSIEIDLALDGFDKKKNVGVEYFTEEDYINSPDSSPSVYLSESYSTACKIIKDQIETTDKSIKAGVFYSPQGPTQEDSARQLRQQIKEFINWLKGQGVI